MIPAVGSLRVKGMDLCFPTTGSLSAKQQNPKCNGDHAPAFQLSAEVCRENQLPHQPQLGRIKQVDLCLEKPSMCSGLGIMY